jgi:hypothetical protein
MNRLSIAVAFGMMLLPNTASACAALTARAQQRQEERQERYLEGFREVAGRWQLEAEGEDGLREGSIHVRSGSRETGRTLHAYFPGDIYCGFPIFPEDAEAGHFYLRRVGPNSWRIIHFESDATWTITHADEERP